MTKKKIITISVAAVLVAGLVTAELAIPLTSYVEFRTRKDEVVDAVIARDSETLKSIKAELKDGVRYYENGLAAPVNDDLIVTAKYGGKYAQATYVTLESDDFMISNVSDMFAESGGDISVTYNGKSTELHCDLTPLELESATIVENPYLVVYGNNDKFDPDGMVINALFNDGIAREIDTFSESTEILSIVNKSANCSFTYLGKTYGFDVPVTVNETVDNGEIKELVLPRGTTMVKAGEQINQEQVNVMGLYESGNRIKLKPNEYYFAEDKTAVLGEECTVQAMLNGHEELTVDVPVYVYQDLECENGKAEGGLTITTSKINNVNSYDPYTRTFTPTGEEATVLNESFKTKISAYNYDVLKGISFNVEMKEACYGDLVLRTTNGMYMGDTARSMGKYVFDDVWSFNVNGSTVHAANEVVVPGVDPSDALLEESTSTPAWNALRSVLVDVRVRHVQFAKGTNVITLYLDWKKESTVSVWNEIGGELLDRIRVEVTDFSQPHTVGDFVEAVEPTCTEDGIYAHAVCSVCDNMVDIEGNNILEPIPALGHDYGEYEKTDEDHVRTCARCGNEDCGTHEYKHVNTDSVNHYDECEVCGKTINEQEHDFELSFTLKNKVYDTAYEFSASDITCGMKCKECGYVNNTPTNDYTFKTKNSGHIRNALVITYKNVDYELPFITKVEAENAALCTLSGGSGTGNNPKVSIAKAKVVECRDDGKIYFAQPEVTVDCVQGFKVKDADWKNSKDGKWSDKNGEKSITVTVNVEKAGKYKLGASMTNSNCQDNTNKFGEIKLGNYFALLADGSSDSIIPDTTVLKGSVCGERDATWTWFFDVDLGEIDLTEGEHTFKFMLEVLPGKWGNMWNDYGDVKVDYFTFELVEHPES